MNFVLKYLVYSFLILVIVANFSCKKRVDELPATTKIDIISLSFGNTKTIAIFTISNSGQQTLDFDITENITWLGLDKTKGQVAGKSSETITVTANRQGLPKNRYEGVISIKTNDKTTDIIAYLTVDMFLVTVINPVFTTVKIEVDSSKNKLAEDNYARLIGAGDSTQFSYFDNPNRFIYFAQTSGLYTDSTILGQQMEWTDILDVEQSHLPRIFLNVPKEYFFLSIINTFQNLFPLYVNAGTAYEEVENIVIFQSSEPLPIGYYQAFDSTVVRAFVYGSSLSVTWSQGDQFNFPFTQNQAIVLKNYLSDTLKSSVPIKHFQLLPSTGIFNRNYGDVIDVFGRGKQ
jgi:hypothetical protein